MRTGRASVFLVALAALLSGVAATSAHAAARVSGYSFVSPPPGARFVRQQSNLIFRAGDPVDSASVDPGLLVVTGSLSGRHMGALELSDDQATLIFTPSIPFFATEQVTATLTPGIRTVAGEPLPPLTLSFLVSADSALALRPARGDRIAAEFPPAALGSGLPPRPTPAAAGDGLPALCPRVRLIDADHPDPGVIFLAPFALSSTLFSNSGDLMIVDNRGQPLFWRHRPKERPLDFKPLPDGRLAYIGSTQVHLLDSTFTAVDSFKTGNGYPIDAHEFQLLPNGHAIVESYDPQPVPMDSIVSGGRNDAVVIGLVLQELDRARRVCFQWRSWDHIPISDCVSQAVDLTGDDIDYMHGNSVEVDRDGNWLVSSRHLNEITKVDRTTGEVLWRMGLHARVNEFTFVGDPRGFSHQHDVRRQANGNITLFDNGNFLVPQYSRALEYSVDETLKVVRRVWEYWTLPNTFGGFMGNVQRRPNGGTLVSWGGNQSALLRVTDLHPDGTRALELGLDAGVFTYRAYRAEWTSPVLHAATSALDFSATAYGSPEAESLAVYVHNDGRAPVTVNRLALTDTAFAATAALPRTLAPGDSMQVQVRFRRVHDGDYAERLYVRAQDDAALVAAGVDLVALERTPPVEPPVTRVAFAMAGANPFRDAAALRFELPRDADVTLDVYDLHGRRVARLARGPWTAGRHTLEWNAGGLAGGIYFARFTADGTVATLRLARLR